MSERRPFCHGTRHTYQAYSCRCRRCRWANTLYQRSLRVAKAKRQPRRGMYVPAKDTWKRLRAMIPEFESAQALAIRLGLTKGLRFNHHRVRLATVLRVDALYFAIMPEDLDAVGEADHAGLR